MIKLLDGNVLLKSEDFKKLKSSSNTLVKKAIQRIEMILSTTNPVEVVFDGEIVVLGVNGGDNMRGTMSSIMNESQFSKLGEVEENRYAIFDLLTQAEFSNKKSEDPLSVRILALYILMFKQLPKIPLPNEFSTSDTLITTAVQPTNWMVSSSPNFNSLYFVNQHLVKSTQHLTLVFNSILECHYEGLMIRKDTGYKGGRK